jgi:hypothetical protein
MRNLLEKGYSYVRRFLLQRETLFSSSEVPQQQGYAPERNQYGGAPAGSGYLPQSGINPQQGYPQRGEMFPQQDYSQQGAMNPREGNPQQEVPSQQGYPQQGYPQPGYPQRGGVNPWVAGGLGALGGGLAGYGLGQAIEGMQPDATSNYHPAEGLGDNAGINGENANPGEMDFGGLDFGGE